MLTLEDRRAVNALAHMGLDEYPAKCCGECDCWYGIRAEGDRLVNDQRAPWGMCMHDDVKEVVPALFNECPVYEGWLS